MWQRAWASVALALAIAGNGCNPHVERQGHVTSDYIGKPVEIRGKAANAKGGAIVMIDEQPIYVRGLASWPAEAEGKRVVVHGVLSTMQYLPVATKNDKGEISQGVEGGALQKVVTLGDWEIEKLAPPEPAKK
jgi:hypothetical protein